MSHDLKVPDDPEPPGNWLAGWRCRRPVTITNGEAPVTYGLVNLWGFDEGRGTTVPDSAGQVTGNIAGDVGWVNEGKGK